jgi:hypothetical protein
MFYGRREDAQLGVFLEKEWENKKWLRRGLFYDRITPKRATCLNAKITKRQTKERSWRKKESKANK